MEALVDKVRGKFFGALHVLTSKASPVQRLRVLQTVVWGSIRRAAGVLFPAPKQQQLLNYFQYTCVKQ